MQLRLLTWNIWMMPPLFRLSPKNTARASAIGDELNKRPFDVICFVKAFDGWARDALQAKLGHDYPHRCGPVNANGSIDTFNGGVWVLSRFPLFVVKEIKFRDSSFVEGFARKGAMLVRGEIDGCMFQLICTHLQGEESNQAIRDKQVRQIADELIATHVDPDVPLFVCGDFATGRRDPKNLFDDSPGYLRTLATLGVENDTEHHITLDDRRSHNDIAMDNVGRIAELDYILVREHDLAATGKWERIIFRNSSWDGGKRKDLSYRYALSGTFTLQPKP